MIKEVFGIIVNERNYSENDKIITVFADDGMLYQIKVIAARKLKNHNRGKTQMFTMGTFAFNEKNDKFSTLKDVSVKNSFINLKVDIDKYYNALYFSEFITKLGYFESLNPKLFEQYILAIERIVNANSYKEIRVAFEMIVLSYSGIQPNLESCVSCMNSKVVAISVVSGGFLCSNCIDNSAKFYNIKTLAMLKKLSTIDFNSVGNISISDTVLNELDEFINEYIEYHLHIKLNTKKFL